MSDFSNKIPLVKQIESLLPQTQCGKCGYATCHLYAEAIAQGNAIYNQCPPGGSQGIARLASLLNKPILPLNVTHGPERSRQRAVIDESACIGCTLCIQVCPVDAIIGAAKQLHTVLEDVCTGCDLCISPCPVDCINLIEVTPNKIGWDAWSQNQANTAHKRYNFKSFRLRREKEESDSYLDAKKAAAQVILDSVLIETQIK